MGKGEETKRTILDHASSLASRVGLGALTIGQLADDLTLSKSGLFAHFRSKESLQIQVLEHAAEQFVDAVIKPALKAPRGERRVRAIFDRWRRWPETSGMVGGCFFVAAAAELDDQPGPARDVLVQQQRDWVDVLGTVVRTAVDEGDFGDAVSPEQFAFELWGIMLTYHHSIRLLGDETSSERADRAFEALIDRARI